MKKLYIKFISSFLIMKVTVRLCPSLLHPWLPRVKKRGAQPNPWLANMRNWQPSLFNILKGILNKWKKSIKDKKKTKKNKHRFSD
jgi:hypothetical protein